MAQATFTASEFWAELDAIGEGQVRINLIKKIYGDHGEKRELAVEWLRRNDEASTLEASAKRDSREEETLLIARDANRIASRAERWAMYAAIAAVIALIISIVRKQT